MTALEFEAWISDNYDELLSRWIAGNRDGQDEQDAFHAALEGMIESGFETVNARIAEEPDFDLFIWTTNQLRGYLKRIRDSRRTRNEAMADFEDQAVLGSDRFLDPERDRIKRHQRRLRLQQNGSLEHSLKLEGDASQEVRAGHLFYGQTGQIRWRYQTLRDNKLFNERAIRSLADSMHRASQSYRHDGEHGFAYSEFGQGVTR